MKLTTFIQSYKLALSEIYSKTKNWDRVYLGEVEIPTDENTIITFIFSTTPGMDTQSIGLKVGFNYHAVEAFMSDLGKISVASEYIDRYSPINDIGRLLLVLEMLYENISSMQYQKCDLLSVRFDLEKSMAVFNFNFVDEEDYSMSVYTDGNMLMFGDHHKK